MARWHDRYIAFILPTKATAGTVDQYRETFIVCMLPAISTEVRNYIEKQRRQQHSEWKHLLVIGKGSLARDIENATERCAREQTGRVKGTHNRSSVVAQATGLIGDTSVPH